jgi:hypothetical protein
LHESKRCRIRAIFGDSGLAASRIEMLVLDRDTPREDRTGTGTLILAGVWLIFRQGKTGRAGGMRNGAAAGVKKVTCDVLASTAPYGHFSSHVTRHMSLSS